MSTPHAPSRDLTFLAPPDEPKDWRMVLLHEAAVDNGLLDALPGSAADLATGLGLDAHGVSVVLDGLSVWDIVVADPDGTYSLGPAAPDADATAMLRHHARSIRNWGNLGERVRGVPPDRTRMAPGGVEVMLDALAVLGRESAPGAVDACLAQAPGAGSVLDLGGGHGMFGLEFSRRGLRSVMQDRPEVVELARRKGWLAGSDVELFAGDFFEQVPGETFDIVFCAGVVYTLAAERVRRLFDRVRPRIAAGGLLAVHTFLGGTDELSTVFSAQMLGGGSGGRSHPESALRRCFDEAGYRFVATQQLRLRPESMLFASPRDS